MCGRGFDRPDRTDAAAAGGLDAAARDDANSADARASGTAAFNRDHHHHV